MYRKDKDEPRARLHCWVKTPIMEGIKSAAKQEGVSVAELVERRLEECYGAHESTETEPAVLARAANTQDNEGIHAREARPEHARLVRQPLSRTRYIT